MPNPVMYKTISIGLSALPLLILFNGCSASGQKGGPGAPAAPPVMVMQVQPRDAAIYSDFSAQTYARNMVEVRGRVKATSNAGCSSPARRFGPARFSMFSISGPTRRRWQQAQGNLQQGEADLEFARHQVSLLQAKANLASAKANLVKAHQDYDRFMPLVKDDAASKQDLDAATAALRAAQANVNALQANVDQTSLSTRTQIDSAEGRWNP